jgi:Xaa-Pro aminopeptidase
MPDPERVSRILAALRELHLDALVCALPMNVLMLSGYWPVVGTAVAVCTRDGEVWIAAPEAESEFAAAAKPTQLEHFAPGSLKDLGGLPAGRALAKLWQGPAMETKMRVGVETDPATVPVGYSALHIYMSALREFLERELSLTLVPADAALAQLRAVKTPREIDFIRAACAFAHRGFAAGQEAAIAGATELDVALVARHQFALPAANEEHHRADGFAWCMSGPNSADAGAAFARSQSRRLQTSDVVLLHANSYLDGYWTDITRTFSVDRASTELHTITTVIAEAREAALAAIRPGASAAAVDAAARHVIARHGYGDYFTHGLGHEVGFGAISLAPPRLHPASPDVLEAGMVMNVEPSIYLPDRFGVRHCDVVAVTESGVEVLTDWLPPS